MEMNSRELVTVVGGLSISGTLINSFTRAIQTILDLGRSLGSAVRRIYEKDCCSL